MIPLAELPSTEGVYVIHFDRPLAHAHGYVGWAADTARRVAEHLDVEACVRAGFHLSADACRRAGGCQHRTHHAGSPLVCAPSAPAGPSRSPRSTQVAIAASNGDCTIGTTRVSVSSAAASARRGRASFVYRSAREAADDARPPPPCSGDCAMDSHPGAPTDTDLKRLPSGACVDSCADCGTTLVGATLDEVLEARCACPPTRYGYLVELQCVLCARPVTSIRVPTPRTRVVLLRPICCQTCGGAAVQGDVLQVAVREPIVFRDRPPHRGRPPKSLVEQHRLRRTP